MKEEELKELEKALRAANPRLPWESLPEWHPYDRLKIAAVNAAPSLLADLREARDWKERAGSMLARWAEADHCHGHICDSDPNGPCEVRRLEDETRAFLGNAAAQPTPPAPPEDAKERK